MAVGTPVTLGLATPASATSIVLTTVADAPAAQAIAVFPFSLASSADPTGVTDSAGNTYQVITTDAAGTSISLYVCTNPVHLVLGGTITANFNGVASAHGLGALTCPGILPSTDPHDLRTGPTSGTSTSSTLITTNTLTQADELAFFGIGYSGTITAWTPSAGWTGILAGNATAFGQVAYQVISATTAITASSTWGTTRGYRARVWSLKGDTQPYWQSRSLLGVGS